MTQSFATDVDIDAKGRVMVVGYICNDDCKPEAWLWMFDPNGKMIWQTSTGLHSDPVFAPRDLHWSSASYWLVASSGTLGNESESLIRAYEPFNPDPLWTYSRKDANVINFVLTIATGHFGEVYAGGWGANGFPAFAIVHG
ncbi:MAG TPA: hypothetical protein ENK31_07570 [Nannocystis exedens]|nr:hypothetical protein [Nannocystis exedens]